MIRYKIVNHVSEKMEQSCITYPVFFFHHPQRAQFFLQIQEFEIRNEENEKIMEVVHLQISQRKQWTEAEKSVLRISQGLVNTLKQFFSTVSFLSMLALLLY